MCNCPVKCLPLFQLVHLTGTFFITYAVAVAKKHVYPFWPYISDTGTYPPESCIFSLSLNTSCVILVLIIYVRQEQVSEFTKWRPYAEVWRKWNSLGSGAAYVGVFGLALVANFQETNAFWIHSVGAIICFIFTAVYFLHQCIITYKMKLASRLIFWWRVIFTVINVVSFPLVFAPLKAALAEYKGNNHQMWSPKDGGYHFHLISTISEWILVLSISLFISTFYWEFRRFRKISFTAKFVERETRGIVEGFRELGPAGSRF